MSEVICQYPGDREQAIASFLYDEGSSADRRVFEAHIAHCERCRDEVASLGGIRTALGSWVPPEPARPFSFEAERQQVRPAPRILAALAAVPAWAQVAAALFVLGVAAGFARLDIQYDATGFRVRTGWSAAAAPASTPPAGDAPWRAEMASLEQRLRADLRQPVLTAPVSVGPSGAVASSASAAAAQDTLRRVRGMLEESERRQQRELALRVAEAIREINTQRQSDLARIDRSLGTMQNNTGLEILRTRETINNINNYLVRTSSQQRPQ
jgi:hypothetical protein